MMNSKRTDEFGRRMEPAAYQTIRERDAKASDTPWTDAHEDQLGSGKYAVSSKDVRQLERHARALADELQTRALQENRTICALADWRKFEEECKRG